MVICLDGFLLVLSRIQGVSLTLTCVMMHGHRCDLYLTDEAMSAGSSWQWECVSRLSLVSSFQVIFQLFMLFSFYMFPPFLADHSELMRSLEKVFIGCRSANQEWPKEFLGFCISFYI